MISNDQERENALNWVLKRKVKNGESFMKFCEGDVNMGIRITPQTLADWCADYHKAMTPVQPPSTGRKFRHE